MTRDANFCPSCGAAFIQKRLDDVERPYCESCQQFYFPGNHVAVVAFLEWNDKLLLTQRNQDPGLGMWALPGGFVDPGEAPEPAVRREIREETGLDIKITGLQAVYPKGGIGLADLVIVYRAAVTAGEARAGHEASAVAWYSRENLPQLFFHPCITLTSLWRKGKLPL